MRSYDIPDAKPLLAIDGEGKWVERVEAEEEQTERERNADNKATRLRAALKEVEELCFQEGVSDVRGLVDLIRRLEAAERQITRMHRYDPEMFRTLDRLSEADEKRLKARGGGDE